MGELCCMLTAKVRKARDEPKQGSELYSRNHLLCCRCSSREWRKAYLDALWVVLSTLEHECAGGEAPSAPLS
eukprot:349350-Pelagomonas_calceolata.AAC.1